MEYTLMDIDSPPESPTNNDNNRDIVDIPPSDRTLQRLLSVGVPSEVLDNGYPGLVSYVEEDKTRLQEIVFAILPMDEDVKESLYQSNLATDAVASLTMQDQFRESMVWFRWLMFRGDPRAALVCLAEKNAGQRGVCGAVWGKNDIAYRCRDCEVDQTCAICVPCFQNGSHKDHDYSIIYTRGGCCDCGDKTAWKREGFCSEHRGSEQIPPLPKEFADPVGFVLDPLFLFWRDIILYLEFTIEGNPQTSDLIVEHKKYANEMTFALVEMLLEFCTFSESLLCFVSSMVSSLDGLLEGLVRTEGLLMESVVKKLYELLLKLLTEPEFKYEFAKVFLSYYPIVVSKIITASNEDAVKRFFSLSTFSVQIFTVSTLTPLLVKEMNLLHTLLGCLGDIFSSCRGEDGRLQLPKWANLLEITLQVLEDVRFVMSHDVVPRYVTQFQKDVLQSWMKILAFVQEMDPQKRETGIHIEEEDENTYFPFILCNYIDNIHILLVHGALNSDILESMEDGDNQRHAKVGRISLESSAVAAMGRCCMLGSSSKAEHDSGFHHTLALRCLESLTHECLRAINSGLVVDSSCASFNESSQVTCNMTGKNFLAWKKTFAKFRRGKNISDRLNSSIEGHSSKYTLHYMSSDLLHSQSTGQEGKNVGISYSTDPGINNKDVECAAKGALSLLHLPDWPHITYDVSSQEVSVHIPFHRLLSLILQEALKLYYGESATPSMDNPISYNELLPNLFKHLLSGYHPYGFSAVIMELPLRIRVFFAEVHAGMWRRNGDAPVVSWECYRTIHWSGHALDQDLFLLQCCAAMAPPDAFLKRILDRFGLSTYLLLSCKQSSKYESTLVQEMLTLIIQIVKERRLCGLSIAESLKRELISKLATGDATRSQLVKSLPHDLPKSVDLEKTLNTVAQYIEPSGFNQGMYSLRRPYWKELDLYHPRWSSRDLQLAEERYSRFCSAFALNTQIPRWTPIYYPLNTIAKVATCRAALEIIRAVLFYAVFVTNKMEARAPDSVVLTALHFLSLGLDICNQHRSNGELSCCDGDVIPLLAFSDEEISVGLLSGAEGAGGHSLLSLLVSLMRMHKRDYLDNVLEAGIYNFSALIENILKKFAEMDISCMTTLQQLAPEVVSHLVKLNPDDRKRILETLSESEKCKAKARERQAEILAKMKAEQSKFLRSINSAVDEKSESAQKCDVRLDYEESQEICSLCHDSDFRVPVSYLVLLQKSRLLSFTNRGVPPWECAKLSDKDHICIAGDNVSFHYPQNTLSKSSEGALLSSEGLPPYVVEKLLDELANIGQPGETEAFLRFINDRFPSARNIQAPRKSINTDWKTALNFEILEEKLFSSIKLEIENHLKQSDSMEDVKGDDTTGIDPNRDGESFLFGKYIAALSRDTSNIGSASDDSTPVDPASKLSAHDSFGPADCDGIYISSCGHAVHQGCLDRYLSSLRERYVRRAIFEGGDIVDPDQGEFLCPVCRRLANAILPALPGDLHRDVSSTDTAGPLTSINEVDHSLRLEDAMCLLRCAGNAFRKGELLRAFPMQSNGKVGPDLEPVSHMLSKMYFPGKQDLFYESSRINHSMTMWDTLTYSLVSTEISARCGRKSLKPNLGLCALYRELDLSSGFAMSLLLKIVQSTRSRHYLHVIQRFMGMQLLAESICSGRSLDNFCNSSGNADYMLAFLRLIQSDLSYSDILFWNRASDPVLAHDPFSSLMWVLFCLPYPFLSCEETFLSFVHLFYVVSVAQAIIACSEKFQDVTDKLNYRGCLVAKIFEFVKQFACAKQYFVSSYIDSYCIKDAICSLSLPYLRRCALLWRLLKSSSAVQFYCGDEVLDVSLHATDDLIGSGLDYGEIEELKKMFKIPPLDFVLNDQSISCLVLKWCAHFCKDSKLHNLSCSINLTPTVPFKLMELPHLYQDLLQRFIKQSCPDCKAPLVEPALCLLCGRLCSPSWKSCCRQNGCHSHAMDCGAGTGVFLLIRRTTILLQRSARQAPWPSPYLDAFGEEDIEMRRGKPLYLNDERYAALAYMVASHGLDRSTKVLSETTIGSFLV